MAALDTQPTNIFLFHALEINTNASEVLGTNRRPPFAHLLTDEFRNSCKRIKSTWPRVIHHIQIKHFFGSTVAAFRNFIDANDIDMIICPEDFLFQKVTTQSINPEKLFRKSGIPVLNPVVRRTTIIPKSMEPMAQAVAMLIK